MNAEPHFRTPWLTRLFSITRLKRKVWLAEMLSAESGALFSRQEETLSIHLTFFGWSARPLIPATALPCGPHIHTSTAAHTYRFPTVRLNVEENRLVNAFGEFGICLGGLKGA
jgi:hypothetical protein